MEPEIRLATTDDAVGIAEAHVASWQAAYVGQLPQKLLDNLDPQDRVSGWSQVLARPSPTATSIAVTDSTITGFALVGAARDDDLDADTVGELMGIYVRPEYWDSGVGRHLMVWSLEYLAKTGFSRAVLWVLASNQRAIRFYERGGWVADRTKSGAKEEAIGDVVVQERRYRRSLG